MFDDKINKIPEKGVQASYYSEDKGPSFFARNKIILISIIAFLAILVLFFGVYSFITSRVDETAEPWEEVNEDGSPMLPLIIDSEGNGNGDELKADIAQVEYLSFADFYDEQLEDIKDSTESYDLPINVKTDVSNYYEISRKIDLDEYISDLDNNGFALIDNPFRDSAPNFFSSFSLLRGKDIPILVTSDFLIYYYQNILKEAFKEIEGNIFYRDIWNINQKFFEISDARYRERLKNVGVVNDPVLEAQRLEAAYFATALELLSPKEGQIEEVYSSEAKFSLNDLNQFWFEVPDYLSDDVAEEVRLILLAKEEDKSPVFRYPRDYEKFEVPENYQTSAKLNNFYLATTWMNSVFPLYYKGSYCPECLLSREDWIINMITASYVSEDFSRNQDLKNQWARIYKVVSFFQGLRQELTYLHYDEALRGLFGDEYSIADIFSLDNPTREDNISALQSKVGEFSFSELEGSFNRGNKDERKNIGMRMLQESYWPTNYIFKELTSPNVTNHFSSQDIRRIKDNLYNSGCMNSRTSFYRCRGLGLDVINLVYDIPEDNNYFEENSNYQGYSGQADNIKNQLNIFTKYSWHNNNFWNTLNIIDTFLETNVISGLSFAVNNNWINKNINTALGTWVNIQLPADDFIPASYDIGDSSLAVGEFDYIEPNLHLTRELIANTRMLKDMFFSLEVIKDTDFSYFKLEDLEEKLTMVDRIIEKQLNKEALSYENNADINNLITQFMTKDSKEKSVKIEFPANDVSIIESIQGVKLLIVVYEKEGRKYFAVGPVFNYQESLK